MRRMMSPGSDTGQDPTLTEPSVTLHTAPSAKAVLEADPHTEGVVTIDKGPEKMLVAHPKSYSGKGAHCY